MTTTPVTPTREAPTHPGPRPPQRPAWTPTPETLNPERLCPNQRDRITRGI